MVKWTYSVLKRKGSPLELHYPRTSFKRNPVRKEGASVETGTSEYCLENGVWVVSAKMRAGNSGSQHPLLCEAQVICPCTSCIIIVHTFETSLSVIACGVTSPVISVFLSIHHCHVRTVWSAKNKWDPTSLRCPMFVWFRLPVFADERRRPVIELFSEES